MIKTKTHRKHLYTPLRYPGGKTSLFEFFSHVIESHNWKDVIYIEPYAGGAGAALSLLILGKVNAVIINDYDPAIYSFWLSIINDTDSFIEKIETTELTIEEWQKQKKIYKAADLNRPLDLGFATFYLNRTNHSGILNAGPIGGMAQTGKWKMNARYNKTSLINKIRLIQSKKDKISVTHKDGIEIIKEYGSTDKSFFYVDPPYFIKGTDLYLNAFKLEDHENLANTLNEFKNSKWLLTYDNEPEIRQLYVLRNYRPFDLRYSAHPNSGSGSELMFFSNVINPQVIDGI
ncbi:MAG TPA: DNA adenine methylase [Candidatus Saccharimonadales bacterium]|nr:DNA adenine methylase [Candidatus Saccharimonadales bacterium]